MFRRLLVLAVALACVHVQAEVYKWTDENGKTHYSDKKIASNASEQKILTGSMPLAPVIPSTQPFNYQASRPSKYLAVTKPSSNIIETDIRRGKQFTFYFGGDCISPTSISWEEFQKRHPGYLLDNNDVQVALMRLLDKYNYRNLRYRTDGPMRDLDNNQGYVLHVEYADIKVNACMTRISNAQESGQFDKLSISDFKKTNAWVKLRWTITSSIDDSVLLTGNSQGSANNVDGFDAPTTGTFRAAVMDSLNNLLADRQFYEFMQPTSIPSASSAKSKTATSAANEDQGLHALPSIMKNSYITRAKFAQALTMINPVRMAVTDYYQSHDEWPVYFSDINLDAKGLSEPGLVDKVELRLGGTLHVVLSVDTFGPGQYFQLVPEAKTTVMDWTCKTTLDKSLWAGPCKGI